MRWFYALLLVLVFGGPAVAQSAAQSAGPAGAASHGRRSAAEHFADANITHDGHLTLDQASTGYKSIAKSFGQIDVSHHGYVTMDDIKAWRAAKKSARIAAKHAAADAADGIIRPGQEIQRWLGPQPWQTSTGMIVPMPVEPRRTGVDLPMAPTDGRNPS